MALFDINKKEEEKPKETIKLNQAIVSEIRRAWLIVWMHSYIYYCLGTSIISDIVWDKWAKKLVDLKAKYPNEAKAVKHYDIFADFDGSTGFIIANKATPNLIKKAKQLLMYHKEHNQ